MSAVTPRLASTGVAATSNGASSLLPHDGITMVPFSPTALNNASITPAGPPSTGRTARYDMCTRRTSPGLTPSARSCAVSSPGSTARPLLLLMRVDLRRSLGTEMPVVAKKHYAAEHQCLSRGYETNARHRRLRE